MDLRMTEHPKPVAEPPRHDIEPIRQNSEPTTHDTEVLAKHAEPPGYNAEPPQQDSEPPGHDTEVLAEHAEPPIYDAEPTQQDSEPTRHDTEVPEQEAVEADLPKHAAEPLNDDDDTLAVARLPGLNIEIAHRRLDNGERISIHLQATPSFEAFGRFVEGANPFAFWMQAMQLAWMPWLHATRALMPPAAAEMQRKLMDLGNIS